MSGNVFFLEPKPPFRLDLTVWTLRRRPENMVDRWDGQTYRRVLTLPTGLVEVAVTQISPAKTPRLRVSVEGQAFNPKLKIAVTAALEQLLGLRIDLSGFYKLAARETQLEQLASHFQGMKPPRYETAFETVVVGIASQQVSRTVSLLVLNRLIEKYGANFRNNGASIHAFPCPEDLARLNPSDFRPLGYSHQKARTIIEIANAAADGSLDLEALAEIEDREATERLCELRGIGRWTAEYILLRGFGRIHIFPGDDVGARNGLKRWLRLKKPLDYESVRQTLDHWHPYAGLIYFHMLLDGLASAGFLGAEFSQTQPNHTNTEIELQPRNRIMKHEFNVGNHVEWNSEAGRVRGTITKKIVKPTRFKTYTARASKEDPQYVIKSDKTDHLAMHKGAALKKIAKARSSKTSKTK